MGVPKRKQSNSRTGMRRSHHALTAKQLQACPKCGTMVAQKTLLEVKLNKAFIDEVAMRIILLLNLLNNMFEYLYDQ